MKRAFTVIELLVVVGILSILAAIAFPVIAGAKGGSTSTTCLSNLRQIGLASAIYATDFNDGIPRAPSKLTKWHLTRGTDVFGDARNGLAAALPPVEEVLASYSARPAMWRCTTDHFDDLIAREGVRFRSYFEEIGSSYCYDDARALLNWTFGHYDHQSKHILFADIGSFHGPSSKLANGSRLNAVYADLHAKQVSTDTFIRDFSLGSP